MTESTARFALPLLQAGQAQKELYHNEALALIDIGLAPAVQSVALNTPPTTPALGACWVVGASPTGAWSGLANAIAGWTGGGWRFVMPSAGMTVWSMTDQVFARFTGSTWVVGDMVAARVAIGGNQVVGARRGAIESPTGGSVVDSTARTAIAAILAALRGHGLIDS
jgi:hypothetical protein